MSAATHSLQLPPDPTAARTARDTLRGACPDHPRLDDALLCLSEVVTNAVLHAGSPSVATIEVGRGVLRVEVRDASLTLPRPCPAAVTSTSGRGLVLLDVITDRWGVKLVDGGKVVWFELDDAAPPS